MPQTKILYPLEKDNPNRAAHKSVWKKIRELLDSSVTDTEAENLNDFNYFLSKLSVDFSDYILALRSGLQKPQIFLKRKYVDKTLNAYNKDILRLHKANMEHLGNKFVNGTKISAQKAFYNILGLHMSESSHVEIFVNTSHPDQRVRIQPKFTTEYDWSFHGKTRWVEQYMPSRLLRLI